MVAATPQHHDAEPTRAIPVRLDEDTITRLRDLAAANERTISQEIRFAIRVYVDGLEER